MKPGDVVRKSPVEWEKSTGIRVTDKAGWTAADKPYSDEVTLAEFGQLCAGGQISLRTNTVWG